MSCLAIIPARGGSKGLPRKNLMSLNGKPLIVWTIEAALSAKNVSDVVVTTDSAEIREIALEAGAKAPFLRPAVLAADATPMIDTVLHAVAEYEQHAQKTFEHFVLLQPTCPLRRHDDIDGAIAALRASGGDSIVTVHRLDSGHPHYIYKLHDDRAIPMFPPPSNATRRQDYVPAYLRNGLVYAVSRRTLIEDRSFYGRDVRAYVTDPMRSVNVDTQRDFLLAAFAMENGDGSL